MAVQTESPQGAPVESEATHSAASAGQHTTTTTAPAAEGGLPQFEFQHWGGQMAYLLLLFAILYVLVSRVFAPRIRRVFDERARVIAEALASARTVQDEANAHAQAARQAVADARARAQRTAADAKARTAAESKDRQAQLENELAAKLAEAEARIGAARDQAMANVAGIAGETAQAIVEKLTGTAAPRGAAEAAVAKLQD